MEEWKDITGYEGYYMVSNYGNVKSVSREIVKSDGILQSRIGKDKKLRKDKDGYLVVKLSKNGSDIIVPVHRLVAECFVSGYFENAEVNHKDFNRENNHYKNLEWVTHADNVRHTIKHDRHICSKDISGKNNPNYGNHTLSCKYRDKVLSSLKQSRPGAMNGMATPVGLIYNGVQIDFCYLAECAKYVIDNKLVKSKSIEYIASIISRCAKLHIKYCNLEFVLI